MGSPDPSLDDRPAREIEDLRERAERAERERDQVQREHIAFSERTIGCASRSITEHAIRPAVVTR